MTGKVLLLAFGIAGVHGLPVIGPIAFLAAFLTAASLGGCLASRTETRHTARVTAILGVEASLVSVTFAVAAITARPDCWLLRFWHSRSALPTHMCGFLPCRTCRRRS
jgi:hypothetical protein